MSEKKYLNKSMVEFVLDKASEFKYVDSYDIISYQIDTAKYANALSQTPRLGHFIPCDENDVPMEKPEYEAPKCGCHGICNTPCDEAIKIEEYQQACNRVLFEGFKFYKSNSDFTNQQEPDSEFAVFDYGKNKLAFSFYKKGTGFHTFLSIETFEDLAKTRKNLPLTEAGANFFGL